MKYGRFVVALEKTLSSMERVSVIIPCFNSGETISEAIHSAQSQNWPNIEVVVVDDGSDDLKTVKILEQQNGVVLLRQANAGLSAARNAGIEAATGTYILPLDADDWLEPGAVASLVEALEASDDITTAFCHYALEGDLSGHLEKAYNFFEQLFLNQMPYCLLYPKSVWKQIGGYDCSMTDGYEDWEFNIRLGSLGFHAAVVPRPLFHYRVSKTGMLMSKSRKLHGDIWAFIQKKHKNLYKSIKLVDLWLTWRSKPSTYPLIIYFLLLLLFRLLPRTTFTLLFLSFKKFSHSERAGIRKN